MKIILLIGFGGFIGTIGRYLISILAFENLPATLPYGTMIVNLVGSLLLGFLFGFLTKTAEEDWQLFLMTGFCGGFTTFSTFSLDSLKMLRSGLWSQFAIYNLVSIIGGLVLCFIGYWLTQRYIR